MKRTTSVPLSNRVIAELLCLQGEKEEGYKRKAFFKAAHAAFIWPEEAGALIAQDRSLTELPAVGPFLANTIRGWLENPPPELPVPPPLRQNFLTVSDAHQILADHPRPRQALRGDLQMHTEWSDGSAAIAAMAEAGIDRGYHYIAVTDHTKGLKIAGGIDEIQLAKQAEEIAAVNAEFQHRDFRVLRSVELNLSPAGQGDLDCEFLKGLDLVLGSFHSKLRLTADQTGRYLAALENPCVHILGHPRGRVYNYRLGLQADWQRVFARAAELDKALEIDGYADRQDLDVELLELARAAGVRISFGSDAHHPWQLAFLDLSLAAALLARIPEERILNFMPATALLDWAQSVSRETSARS